MWNLRLGDLTLVLLGGLVAILALEESLAIWVQMELGDDAVGWVDTEGNSGTVVLLTVDALNVDDILAAVNLGDLTITSLEGTTDDLDLIIL